MKREVVQQLVEEAISENSRLFLIDLNFLADNKIIVSTVSPWELALKKDDIIQTDNLENFVKQTCIRHQLTLISPSLSHVCMVKKLPFHHKDPFDRLLIATAIVEKIPLISADRKIALYSIKTIW